MENPISDNDRHLISKLQLNPAWKITFAETRRLNDLIRQRQAALPATTPADEEAAPAADLPPTSPEQEEAGQ